jgi:drug/metabolite transporter (DMT)-like permease
VSHKTTSAQSVRTINGNRLTLGIAVFGIWIVWGAMYLATHKVLTESPPYWMAATRFLTAGSLLFGALAARRAPLPTLIQWRNSALIGAVIIGLGTGFTVFSQQWNSSGLASVIAATGTVWIALLSGLFGARPRPWEWLGIALGVTGVIILFSGSTLTTNPQGLVIGLLGTIAWSVGSVMAQRMALPDGWMRSAAQMLCGGAVLLVISLSRGETPLFMPSPGVLLAWAMAVVGSLMGFGSYMWLLSHSRPTLATSYAYVNPVVAIGLGIIFEGERLLLMEIIGMGVIMIAVIVTAMSARR